MVTAVIKHDLFRRLVSFSAIPFAGLVTPLLLLPIIARTTPVGGWSSIAIGQSVGAFCMMVVTLGWNLRGPVELIRDPLQHAVLLRQSLATRGFALLACALPILGVVSHLAPEEFRWEAVFMAIGIASSGLTPAWYAIGIASPTTLFLCDALPRVAAAALGAWALLAGSSLIVYPILFLAFSLLGTACHAVFTFARAVAVKPTMPVIARLRSLLSPAFSEIAAGSYAAGAVALVSVGASLTQVAIYAAGDRAFRLALYGVSSVANALQSWVALDLEVPFSGKRTRLSLAVHSLIGLFGLVLFSAVGPPATSLLFGPGYAINYMTSIALGLAFFAISVGTSLGRHVLLPRSRHRQFLASTVVGVVLGVPCIVALSSAYGATGGAIGVAVGEWATAVMLGVFLLRLRRSSPAHA